VLGHPAAVELRSSTDLQSVSLDDESDFHSST
jgi:hypothetical protein